MEKIIVILALGFLNYLMRALPFLLFNEKPFPEHIRQWLQYVPVAVLCAILAPMLFITNTKIDFSLNNTILLAAIPTFIVGIISKNMGLILAFGVIAMAVIQYVVR